MGSGETGWWFVDFTIPSSERVALEHAAPRVVGPHAFHVTRSPGAALAFHVEADGEDAAERAARDIYRRVRATAELPDDPTAEAALSILAGRAHPQDLFILDAQDMASQRRFELAVIAAQTHCETWFPRLLAEVAAARDLEGLIDERASWSLTTGYTPRLFQALLGARPADAPCWTEYQAHVERRHGCVHRGDRVTEAEAEESISAAVAMVRYVTGLVDATLGKR